MSALRSYSQDEKLRFITQDAKLTDKNMSLLRKEIEGYIKTSERLRKKSYELATSLKTFGDNEAPQLGSFLYCLSDALHAKEMMREECMQRITFNCVEPLKYYRVLSNNLKSEVRSRENVLGRELNRQTNLDRVLVKDSGNISRMTQKQLELISASQEVEHVTSSLLQSVERFELQKRSDLKNTMSKFLEAELFYHAKALEILSNANKIISETELNEDVNEICDRINSVVSRPGSPNFSMPSQMMGMGMMNQGMHSPQHNIMMPSNRQSSYDAPSPIKMNYQPHSSGVFSPSTAKPNMFMPTAYGNNIQGYGNQFINATSRNPVSGYSSPVGNFPASPMKGSEKRNRSDSRIPTTHSSARHGRSRSMVR